MRAAFSAPGLCDSSLSFASLAIALKIKGGRGEKKGQGGREGRKGGREGGREGGEGGRGGREGEGYVGEELISELHSYKGTEHTTTMRKTSQAVPNLGMEYSASQ